MHFSPANVAVMAQLNRDALPDLCTVEVATPTPTTTGGQTEEWLPVSPELTDVPCRLSMGGKDAERGARLLAGADYIIALDGANPAVRDIKLTHRLQVRSGAPEDEQGGVAWAVTVYLTSADGPASMDPFPKFGGTTTPQAGAR